MILNFVSGSGLGLLVLVQTLTGRLHPFPLLPHRLRRMCWVVGWSLPVGCSIYRQIMFWPAIWHLVPSEPRMEFPV